MVILDTAKVRPEDGRDTTRDGFIWWSDVARMAAVEKDHGWSDFKGTGGVPGMAVEAAREGWRLHHLIPVSVFQQDARELLPA